MEEIPARLQRYIEGFSRAPGVIPLNNAALTPLHARAAGAMHAAIAAMSQPPPQIRATWQLQYQAAHESFARLLACTAEEVTFMPNVASALSAVAQALALAPGDELVTVDQEYASNAYPWRDAAARAGAHVLVAASGPDYALDGEKISELIGPRTRAVVVSWVQFQTGASLDLKQLSTACKAHGALLIVDSTQGVGVTPFSMSESGADIVAGSLHKWLAGPPGLAYLAIRRKLIATLQPRSVGPFSYGESPGSYNPEAQLLGTAARFQSGTPALMPILGAGAAAEAILDAGVESISAQALALAGYLWEGLLERGHQLLSPRAMTSPIVSFRPRQGLERAILQLERHGISFALRAGGLRLSPHAFNTREDIEACWLALQDEGRGC